MKEDIRDRADIELLVRRFYETVKADPMLGPIFTERFKIDWPQHLQRTADFWENSIFFTGTYTGNPMATHRGVHEKNPLNTDDFQRWIQLFTATVDENFAGNKAEFAKQRALTIIEVMKARVLSS